MSIYISHVCKIYIYIYHMYKYKAKLTSNLYCLLGTSKAVISDRLTNCVLWWSFKNAHVGIMPSGAISISNSSPAVNCTCCTYFGKQLEM